MKHRDLKTGELEQTISALWDNIQQPRKQPLSLEFQKVRRGKWRQTKYLKETMAEIFHVWKHLKHGLEKDFGESSFFLNHS